MTALEQRLLGLWYSALHAPPIETPNGPVPGGWYLRAADAPALRPRLYQVRAKAKDPALSTLTLRVSPRDPRRELWIIPAKAKAA